jgi:hypothetical protein
MKEGSCCSRCIKGSPLPRDASSGFLPHGTEFDLGRVAVSR